jgi:hypothetical protein
MAITRLPNINDVASIIENSLNNISAALQASSDISTEIVFKITPEISVYDEMQTSLDSDDNEVRYTPGLLQSLGNFDMTQDVNYTSILESFVLDIYGYEDDREDFKTIMDEYIFQRSHTGDSTQSSNIIFDYIGYRTNYTVSKPIIVGHINSQDGSGIDRFLSSNSFMFTFEDGGISYNDTTLEIDGTEVPYLTYQVSPTNSAVSATWLNEDLTKNITIGSSFTIQIDLPVLSSNAKIVSLLAEAKGLTNNTTNTINTTHTIEFSDSITTETYNCIISQAPYGVQYGGTEGFSLTFVPYKSGVL